MEGLEFFSVVYLNSGTKDSMSKLKTGTVIRAYTDVGQKEENTKFYCSFRRCRVIVNISVDFKNSLVRYSKV